MTILLIEDDALIAQNLKNILLFYNYIIDGPYDSAEAYLNTQPKQVVDLMICDINLAGELNGLQLAEILKKELNIPIIFITAFVDEAIRNQAKVLGAAAFLNKPFNERNLLNSIDLALSSFAKNHQFQAIEQEPSITHRMADKIYVKKHDRYVKVSLSEIDFIEASGHYTIIYTHNDQIMAGCNISTFLQQCSYTSLIKVHRSFAVNINNIPDFDDTFIYFKQKSIPISKSHKDIFKKRLSLI